MTLRSCCEFRIGPLTPSGGNQSGFDAIYIGLDATFEILVDGQVVFREFYWPGVEFAVDLMGWREDDEDEFCYQSMEADEPWLLRFVPVDGLWRIEDREGLELATVAAADLGAAVRGYLAEIDHQLGSRFHVRLADYAHPTAPRDD